MIKSGAYMRCYRLFFISIVFLMNIHLGNASAALICTSAYVSDSIAAIDMGSSGFRLAGGMNDKTLLESEDGQTWSFSGTSDKKLNDLASNDTAYVAVGLNGKVLYSGGSVWTDNSIPTSHELFSVASGINGFVTVGGTESGVIYHSTNGIRWSSVVSGSNAFYGVSFGANKYVSVGYNGVILYSSNGSSWAVANMTNFNHLYAVTYGSGRFVAVGASGTILTSTDAHNWSSQASTTTATLRDITYGDGEFLAVGDYGVILHSSDGLSWGFITPCSSGTFTSVAYNSNRALVGASDGLLLCLGSGCMKDVVISPPVVTGITLDDTRRPAWYWESSGGTGVFRYHEDTDDFSGSYTTTTEKSVTAAIDLPDDLYTLYVQEQLPNGGWSDSGSFTIAVIADSPLFGNLAFIGQSYRDFLNRDADADGLAYWANQLEDGTLIRSELVEQYLLSPEFGDTVSPVVRLYFTYYQRIPDYDGLMFWVDSFAAGMSLNDISDAFAAAQEFIDRYGSLTNEEFISQMYVNVYGRQPDSEGLTFWTNILDTTAMTRGQVMVEFSSAPEYLSISANQVYVAMTYMGLLRRAPEQEGYDFWVNSMDLGVSGLELIDNFLVSDEYASRFTN